MIGSMDRLIVIEKRTVTRDATGGVVETWASSSTAWADYVPQQPTESETNQRQVVTRRAYFQTHYRSDLSEADYRIVYGGATWDITGVLEIGRRREIRIYCQTTN